MRPMNTYDFDKTIFYPDSSVTFVRWYMRRHPFALLCWLPRMAVIGLAYLLNLIPKEKLKENIFSFVRRIDDIDTVLKVYWDEHESWIAPWYRAQHRPDDIVISASPEFVVKPMTDRLGIALSRQASKRLQENMLQYFQGTSARAKCTAATATARKRCAGSMPLTPVP